MLKCPHCNSPVEMRELKHEGWFVTRRTCPSCRLSFDLDRVTKTRQFVFLVVLVLGLVFTVLVYVHGRWWAPFAIASYILAGALLIYGNRKMYLVKATRSEHR